VFSARSSRFLGAAESAQVKQWVLVGRGVPARGTGVVDAKCIWPGNYAAGMEQGFKALPKGRPELDALT